MRVYGTKNTLELDFSKRTVVLAAAQKYPSALGRLVPAFQMAGRYLSAGRRNVAAFRRHKFQYFAGMSTLLERFYDGIRTGGEPPIPYAEILRVVTVMDRVVEQVYPIEGGAMKILVTGAGGFLGKRIVERLLAHGQTDLRAMLRDPAKGSALTELAVRYPSAQVELFQANLKNPSEIAAAVDGGGLVIHAAAALKGSPAEMFLDSVVASRNLLDAVVALPAEARPRVVLISSFGVMGVAALKRGAVVDERVPLETRPAERDVYSHTKLRQERLFWEYRDRHGFELVVLRPGVIYGPGGGHFSNRVGLKLFGRFVHLGHGNLLPLTYVDNCAEAIVTAALAPQTAGEVYNVVDDDLPSSREYLRLYKRQVKPMRTLPVPYWLLHWGSRLVERYSKRSKGQLPAIFTPYKTKAMWGGNRFSNAKLKGLGWRPLVPTRDALEQTFASFRQEPEKAK